MPFWGVLKKRAAIFSPYAPRQDIGVSDPEAWRLNPTHRHIYNKLSVALSQGLRAAPAGVRPQNFGFVHEENVFVRPIINLAGMGVGARSEPVDGLRCEAGEFWCEELAGEHISTDCLMQHGKCRWFAHTLGSAEKHQQRSLLWSIGVERCELESSITTWLETQLAGYTGLCNIETIGGIVIEAHLRGSNGFFEFYGDDFFNAWVALIDEGRWLGAPKKPKGFVQSVFVDDEGPYKIDINLLKQGLARSCEIDIELGDDGCPLNYRVAVIRGTVLSDISAATDLVCKALSKD